MTNYFSPSAQLFCPSQTFSPQACAAPAAASTSLALAVLGKCHWSVCFSCHLGVAVGRCPTLQKKWGASGAEMSWTGKALRWSLWNAVGNISEWLTLAEYIRVPECFQFCLKWRLQPYVLQHYTGCWLSLFAIRFLIIFSSLFCFCHQQQVLVFLWHCCTCAWVFQLMQKLFLQLLILWFFFTELQVHINISEYPDIFAFCDLNMNEQILLLLCSETLVRGVVEQSGWWRFVMTFFLNYWIYLALC